MSLTFSDFLRNTSPFDLLPEEEIEFLTGIFFRREYAAGALIYQQDMSLLQELSVIRSGRVEKYFQVGEGRKDYAECFGPGETFGAISILLNNQRAIRSVRALEPTIIYQLPEIYFQELCRKYEQFYAFFTQEFGKRMLTGGYAAAMMRPSGTATGFQQADLSFTRRIGDTFTPNLNACLPDTPIREAARSMTLHRRPYVVVMGADREPAGIVTDADLRTEVIVNNASREAPISTIMRSPVPEIDADAVAYEGILQMFRLKTDLLAVRQAGRLTGIVTLDQLLNDQSKSPFLFIQAISFEYNADGLKARWREMPAIIDSLIARGMRPEIVSQIVSSVADAIAQNVVRRAVKTLGTPPAAFAFVALGSEGRKEQTLSTDQDNALIYADVPESRQEEVQTYFSCLGETICDELDEIGFAYCEGELMARNPRWNQPLARWQGIFRRWLREPVMEHVMMASAIFDGRVIYGEAELLDQLRITAWDEWRESSGGFLGQLARISLNNRTPLSLFGQIQVTETGDGRKGINAKRVMSIISDFARIYALHYRLPATNTEERLRNILEKGGLTAEEFHELHQSFFFLMRLRLTHQTRQLVAGEKPDNFLLMSSLSKIERVTIREIFRVIEAYQKRISVVFAGVMSI
ncbi:MAG: DUF294 nucleotidyltransferase-like domain-containing protein [Bacteroidia bacterium]|nr:DUF294 nucleotidyltransferase-like domain-containing protein [Bacteroidia bacterium]